MFIFGGPGFTGICLGTPPHEIQVHLQAGEARDVVVDLGTDSRPDLDFLAKLIPPEQEAWRKGLLTLSLPDANDVSVPELRLPHQPAGRQVRIRISARHCSPAGHYAARLEISTIEKRSERPTGSSEVIPLRIDVVGDGICASTKATAGGSALLVVLLGLYVRFMFLNSIFLTPTALAGRLRPLRWTEDGDAGPAGDRIQDLRFRISRQLPWRSRIKAWLTANPFVFGFPGKRYEETVLIELGRRPDDLFLTPVPRRQILEHLTVHPEDGRGRLFAKAEQGGGISFLGMPDGRGRIGDLVPDRSLRADQVSNLSKLRLVEFDPPDDRTSRPAGWEIVGSGGRS